MDEDYGRPGDPRPYADPPRGMTDEDRSFFADLDRRYWRPLAPDRFGLGRVGRTPHGTLTTNELVRVLSLILDCRLLTKIGSGMYGLSGYSMAIHEVPGPAGMSEDPPRRLFTLMSDHVHRERIGDLRGSDQKDWILFTSFTHSPENLAMLDFHKMGRPKDRFDYDY